MFYAFLHKLPVYPLSFAGSRSLPHTIRFILLAVSDPLCESTYCFHECTNLKSSPTLLSRAPVSPPNSSLRRVRTKATYLPPSLLNPPPSTHTPILPPFLTMSQSQPSQPSGGQQIDLTTLSTPQLSQLQGRLSQELDHLTSSYARLRQAQGRFRDCIRSIQEGVQGKDVGE